jgi:hypothetical protein
MKNLNRDDFHTFRGSFVKIILGTDMAKHKTYVDKLNEIITLKYIDEENGNNNNIIDTTTKITKYKSQQLLLESCVHTADLSV